MSTEQLTLDPVAGQPRKHQQQLRAITHMHIFELHLCRRYLGSLSPSRRVPVCAHCRLTRHCRMASIRRKLVLATKCANFTSQKSQSRQAPAKLTSPLDGQESGQAPGSSAGGSSGATLYSWMRSTALNAFSARLASRTCEQHANPMEFIARKPPLSNADQPL